MLKLFGQARSRASRSLWMLEEIGIPYEHVKVRPYTESRSPDYLRINPRTYSEPAELAQSIEVRDVSRGTTPAYTVGTSHLLGRILEFGTLRRPASPWLWPVFRARLPAIKDNLRKLASAASKTSRGLIANR